MKNFAALFKELDETIQPEFKVAALINYFQKVLPCDAAWALNLLSGRKFKQLVTLKKLQEWSVELAQIPEWLFFECRNNVSDLTETISLILPCKGNTENIPLQTLIEQHLIPLRNQEEKVQKENIISVWQKLNSTEMYIWNKLVTGSFHFDIMPKLIIKALSRFCNMPESIISYRLSGNWAPFADFFNRLCSPEVAGSIIYNAYPFNNPVKLNQKVEELGEINEWLAEWKWKGIRSQIIKRENKIFIWSKDQDFLNDTFPELYEPGSKLPDGTVLDGIIIPMKNDVPLSSSDLQKRIAKKYPDSKILSVIPVAFVAFDLLEFNDEDVRTKSLLQRRAILIKIVNNFNDKRIILSPNVEFNYWNDLQKVKEYGIKISTDGLILKRFDSPYYLGVENISAPQKAGISASNWFEWKNDPLSILAVLLYARLEQGSTVPLFKEYTFAIWHEGNLIPFTKTSFGLTHEEVIQVDTFIRNNTVEKFGPVRTVKPELIFQLEFDSVQKSSRHKSGIFVHSPRIIRWDHDKTIHEIGSLSSLADIASY